MTETHWTDRSPEDFLYSIASDFVEQLRTKMKAIRMSQAKLARTARVSKGYVSQVFNDPGNLSLVTIVKFAKAVGMKVSVVGYEDNTEEREGYGPINSGVFRLCWEKHGRPVDMWSFKEQGTATTPNTIDVRTFIDNLSLGYEVFLSTPPSPPQPHAVYQLPIYVNKLSRATGRKYTTLAVASGGQ